MGKGQAAMVKKLKMTDPGPDFCGISEPPKGIRWKTFCVKLKKPYPSMGPGFTAPRCSSCGRKHKPGTNSELRPLVAEGVPMVLCASCAWWSCMAHGSYEQDGVLQLYVSPDGSFLQALLDGWRRKRHYSPPGMLIGLRSMSMPLSKQTLAKPLTPYP